MAYKVKEAVTVAIGNEPERTFKTGVQEAKPADVAALEHLVTLGLAEHVKDKEE